MRFALISDIHGNTVALDAVLEDLAGSAIDHVVCLGDIAAGGPDPGGAIDRIAALGGTCVQGNTDAGLVETPNWWHDPGSLGLPENARPGLDISVWCGERLSDGQQRFLAELPLTAELDLSSPGRLLAFHGSPTSADDFIGANTPDDELTTMLGEVSHGLLAGGHTHVPMVRRFGSQTLVNPGSIGLPFAEYGYAGGVRVMPYAEFAVVEAHGSTMSIELRRIAVDARKLAASVARSEMPHAQWWLDLRSNATNTTEDA